MSAELNDGIWGADTTNRNGVWGVGYDQGLPANPTTEDLLVQRLALIMFDADFPDGRYPFRQPPDANNRIYWHYARILVAAGVSFSHCVPDTSTQPVPVSL